MVGYPDWIVDTKKLDSYYYGVSILRSSRSEMLGKKAVVKNFAKFTGKHMRVSFLIKLDDTCY